MQGHDADRIKMDAGCWRVLCLQCEQEFEARRSDATFCSTRCRVAYSREPEKLNNAIAYCDQLARMLDRQAQKYYRSPRMYVAMKALRDSLTGSLARFEIEG